MSGTQVCIVYEAHHLYDNWRRKMRCEYEKLNNNKELMLITGDSSPSANTESVRKEMLEHSDYYNVIFVDSAISDASVTDLIDQYNVAREGNRKGVSLMEFGSRYNAVDSRNIISTDSDLDFIQSLIKLYNTAQNNFLIVKGDLSGSSINPVIKRNEVVSNFTYTDKDGFNRTTYCYSSLVKSVLADIGKGEQSMMDVLQRSKQQMKETEINRLEAMNVLSSNQSYKAMGLLASSANVSDANLAPDVNTHGAQLPSSSLDKDISSFMQI